MSTLEPEDDEAMKIKSCFQIARVTRPLMSVGKICDQGLLFVFDKTHARITDKKGNEIAKFERGGDSGLYTCTMRLKKPGETDNTSGFARQDR